MQHDSEEHRLPDAKRRLAALSAVRADLLDCVQSNLAVLADHFHGRGTHLRLGSRLSSRWYPGADGLPTVDPPLAEQLVEAERCLDLRVTGQKTVTGGDLPGAVQPGAPCYAVADAYEMPWLPYHRRRHMDHSFLLIAPDAADDGWTVVDAYDNDTPWGAARPGAWTLTADQLAVLGEVELFRIAPGPSGAGDGPRIRVEHVPMDDYLAALHQGADREAVLHRLTGDAWLLARSRTLHALFVADGAPDEETARHLERWNQLVTHTYVAYRRVARGRPEPPGLVDRLAELLEADRNVFPDTGKPAAPPTAAGLPGDAASDRVRVQVAEVVAAVLGGDPGSLGAGTDLRTVEGFTSFRMVDIIERLEAELGVEFDSDDLVPENLRSVEGLCRVVRGAREPAEP
ncbi:acyl carrier protein [Streptomyces sp. NPDC028635]|uniref:acyl carrier protein n=1 Tax=Streptomyces sp. NPDC028635 TaxID=3154800 RepID=UPI00340F50E3